jgi:hypothetical protein
LPFETPELVDTLSEVAATSNWIAHQLIGGTDAPVFGVRAEQRAVALAAT